MLLRHAPQRRRCYVDKIINEHHGISPLIFFPSARDARKTNCILITLYVCIKLGN